MLYSRVCGYSDLEWDRVHFCWNALESRELCLSSLGVLYVLFLKSQIDQSGGLKSWLFLSGAIFLNVEVSY